jgi:hypothetical protein
MLRPWRGRLGVAEGRRDVFELLPRGSCVWQEPAFPPKLALSPMPTSTARKAPAATVRTGVRARRAAPPDPIIVYAASSLDGTSFALDPASARRIKQAFPDVHVSTRHVYISHDTRGAFEESIGPFEDQIAILLTGVPAERLTEHFSLVSFRDPKSERELGRLPMPRARATR